MKNANTKSRVSSVSKSRARLLTSWAAVSALAASLLFIGLLTGCPNGSGPNRPNEPDQPPAVDPAAILRTDGNGKITGYKCAKEELPAHLVIPAKIGDEEIKEIDTDAFKYCTGLISISLPENITKIGIWAFYSCTGLISISLPTNLTTIGGEAFYDCRGLTSVRLSANLTTIGDGAFYYCRGLTSVRLPANLTTIDEDAFSGCTGLTSLTIDSANTKYKTEGNILYSKNGTTLIFAAGGLTSANIPDTVTTIGNRAFYYCSGLTSTSLPANLTTIGGEAFSNCKGLTNISLPANLTQISQYAFSGCTGLTSLDLSGYTSLTTIGDWAFSECKGLTEIKLPANLTEIDYGVFSGCTGLTSAVFADKEGWKVYDNYDYSGTPTPISPSDLENEQTAAKYLREESDNGGYCNKWWKKN